jgi:hypothetical protein
VNRKLLALAVAFPLIVGGCAGWRAMSAEDQETAVASVETAANTAALLIPPPFNLLALAAVQVGTALVREKINDEEEA